jgi:hypothetical protein
MGCDIHILFQVFDTALNRWYIVKQNDDDLQLVEEGEIPELYHQGDMMSTYAVSSNTDEGSINEDDIELWSEAMARFWFYVDRDYLLFAKLANVRNDYGLLNVYEPRGLPDGLDDKIKEMLSDGDLHSHTWLLDHEIEKIDMDEMPISRGSRFIHASVYEKLREDNLIVSMHDRNALLVALIGSKGLNDENIHRYVDRKEFFQYVTGFIYTQDEWDAFSSERRARELSRPPEYGEKRNMVFIQFETSQKKTCPGYEALMEHLTKIKTAYPGRQVRALICFDN